MAVTRCWLCFLGHGTLSLRSVIADSLAQVGVTTDVLETEGRAGLGLVFFDEITPRLCEFLREVSNYGLNRVLAIATERSALAGGRCWRLLQAGASDAIAWEQPTRSARDIASRLERWETVDQLVHSPMVQNNCVGQSPAWIAVLRQIVEVAYFTDTSILITGESGTGKELVARLIHTLDQRPNKRDLVVLDCTTIVRELSGSEFFGHVRGAFTGAVSDRDGAFALADGGTLFLDEVGELPPVLQAELLRAIQEHTYKRVGSNTWQRSNFRLVCATNCNLLHQEAQGRFRRDFYYRIAGWACQLPPLGARPDDILPLVSHFMRELRLGQEPPELDDAVGEYLLQRPYPGNVRDLKKVVARILYRHVGSGPITVGDIPEEERPAPSPGPLDWCDESFERAIGRALAQGVPLKDIGRGAENTAVRLAFRAENGNLQRAARRLGVTDRALQMRRAARRQFDSAKDNSHKQPASDS